MPKKSTFFDKIRKALQECLAVVGSCCRPKQIHILYDQCPSYTPIKSRLWYLNEEDQMPKIENIDMDELGSSK